MSKTTLLTQVKNPGAFADFFENTDNGTILGFVVVFLLILAVVACFAWLLAKSARGMKGQREEKEKQEWRTVKYNSTLNGTVTHVSGLPMGEGVTLELYYGPKQLVFWKDGTEVILPREKVRSIDLASPKKRRNYNCSRCRYWPSYTWRNCRSSYWLTVRKQAVSGNLL